MASSRRRFLAAGGIGGFGAAVGLERTTPAAVFDSGHIDLTATPYEVVADNPAPAVAVNNARAINDAIEDHPTATHFVLPSGAVFVSRDLGVTGIYRYAAIRIVGENKRGLVLSGRGAGVTRIVMTGPQQNGLSQIIQVADGPRQIVFRDFSIEHGPVDDPDTIELKNHQIELNAENENVTDIEIHNVFFGPCIGDGIRMTGGNALASPTQLRGVRIHHVTMRLNGHPAVPLGCRSGISFQKGISDLVLSDFYLIGAKNSCLDMEPTSHSRMDNITITNGTVDNTLGATWEAASFDGFEDESGVTSFLTNSRMVNVRIKGGQLQVVSTRGCTLDNVVIEARRDAPDGPHAPLLYVVRENEDLTIRNVDIVRDAGCPAGPLVTVRNTTKSSKRITVEGGTWTTRVPPGRDLAYVDVVDADRFRMRGTRVRVEDTISGTRYGFRIVPSRQDMTNVHLDGVAIESPDGLRAGFWFATNLGRRILNIRVDGCTLTGAATHGILFDAVGGGEMDRFPVVQGNDFERCADAWTAINLANGVVFPVIAGNRGGRCTLTGIPAPENLVAAAPGSQYVRHNGELWLKSTGTGPTGWRVL